MSTLTITVHCPEFAEPNAFARACKKALDMAGVGDEPRNVNLIMQPRKENGWLEYFIDLSDANHKRIIMVGMIQRTELSEYEFHS